MLQTPGKIKQDSPITDEHLPMEQAGFQQNQSYVDQVLNLTSYVEEDFIEA